MAGLTVILGRSSETFNDDSVLTIILVVSSRHWLTFCGDTMASAFLLTLVVCAVMMINVDAW